MTSFLASIIGGPFSTPVGQLIEKATDVGQVSEDWGLYMEICDLVNSSDDGPKDAIKAIKKQLSNNIGKNNVVILYTLTVLETCVKNCGKRFHILVAQKDFLQELIRVISPKGNPPQIVVDKVLGMLQTWGDAFQGIEELKEVERVCKELKDKGMEFPMTDLDRIAPIHTPARSTPLAEPSSPSRQDHQLIDCQMPADLDSDLGTEVVAVEAEQLAKLRSELDVVQQNCKVMSEMLTELTPGQEPIEDDWQLLTELNATCHHMQKRIVELIERVQSEDVTCELLRINDDLNNVLLRYERYERLRGGPANQISSAASAPPIYATVQKPTPKSDKDSGDHLTGTLVDLSDSNSAPAPSVTHSAYDEASNMATLSIRDTAAAKAPTVTTSSDGAPNEEDFDMFAQSRKGYEQSRQALSGDRYDRQQDDQMLSGLGTAVTLKSKGNPYSDEAETGEMDKWMKESQGAQQQSATSSEFDQFLATHTSAESERLLDPQASPSQRSSNRGGRTLQNNGDDDQALFTL